MYLKISNYTSEIFSNIALGLGKPFKSTEKIVRYGIEEIYFRNPQKTLRWL